MQFTKASFGDAEDVLKKKDKAITDIQHVLQDLNTTIMWHGQAQLNGDIANLFGRRGGWDPQVDSLLKSEAGKDDAGAKSVDFRNVAERVDVEIEFGNVGSFYRDIFKLNIAKKANQIDVGVIIVGNKEIAGTVGENIASFERFNDELSISWKHGANADCPVMVYGLLPLSYPSNTSLIDPRAKQAKEELMKKRVEKKTLTSSDQEKLH